LVFLLLMYPFKKKGFVNLKKKGRFKNRPFKLLLTICQFLQEQQLKKR